MNDKISREELIKIYNIEIQFFDELEEYGLLNIITENNVKYLHYEELQSFERLTNWHYDYDVNLPGLQIFQDLIFKIEKLQTENKRLTRRTTIISQQIEDYDG